MVSCPWMWPQVWLLPETIKIRACLSWPLIWLEIYRSCRFIDLLSYYVEFLSFPLLVFSLFGPPVFDQGINLSMPSWRMSQIWKWIPRNEERGERRLVGGVRREEAQILFFTEVYPASVTRKRCDIKLEHRNQPLQILLLYWQVLSVIQMWSNPNEGIFNIWLGT